MAMFAIIPTSSTGAEKMRIAIPAKFPKSHYDLGMGAWLIFGPSTAKDASVLAGITDDDDGGIGGVVIEVASYFGRTNPAVWTWLRSNWEN